MCLTYPTVPWRLPKFIAGGMAGPANGKGAIRSVLLTAPYAVQLTGLGQACVSCGRAALVNEVPVQNEADLPLLLTADDTACLLRTSRKVVYEMIRLGRLPGVTRIGRRVLLRRDRLLEYLLEREEQPVSSLGGR